MHIEDSPAERTSDLVTKVRALREQAEKQMNQFTHADDYDVRRVTGRKPKVESAETPSQAAPNRKRRKNAEQASIDFASARSETDPSEGEDV